MYSNDDCYIALLQMMRRRFPCIYISTRYYTLLPRPSSCLASSEGSISPIGDFLPLELIGLPASPILESGGSVNVFLPASSDGLRRLLLIDNFGDGPGNAKLLVVDLAIPMIYNTDGIGGIVKCSPYFGWCAVLALTSPGVSVIGRCVGRWVLGVPVPRVLHWG
jgi:hypothetical protein